MKLRAIRPITATIVQTLHCRVSRIVAPAAIVLLGAPALRAQPAQVANHADAPPTSRIVLRFDFEEPNYYDEVPRGWMRFPDADAGDPAFPRYTSGRLDHDVGRSAAPSFYLASAGRSVAYRYVGGETRVRMGEYLVSGWIRPDRLAHARAALSAYYLDWEGEPVAGTQRFSRLIGSTGSADSAANTGADAWRSVEVRLPTAPSNAHFVGITCWVVQDSVFLGDTATHRHINLRDIDGGAWFDDITVQGLPRGRLTTRHPGNVVVSPAPVQLLANVADNEVAGLTSEVIVRDRRGTVIATRAVPVRIFEDAVDEEITLVGFQPGLYQAQLVVRSLAEPILERTLTIGVLAEAHQPRDGVFEKMGVTLREAPATATSDTVALISNLGVGSVKLPLWTGDLSQPAFDDHPHELHDLLDGLLAERLDVIGVFSGPPTSVLRVSGAYPPTLLEVLTQDPRGWRDEIDAIIAPYANIFYAWQLGDDRRNLADHPATEQALVALQASIRELLPEPNLAVMINAGNEPPHRPLPVRNLALAVPADVQPARVEDHVAPHRSSAYDQLWISVPPTETQYDAQDAALSDWALRLIAARWTNVARVFAPAPWHERRTATRVVVEPTASYLVLRTIIDVLGDAAPVAEFELGSTARVQAFGDGRTATMVAWDPFAPPQGSTTILQLGAADHAVDLWGRRYPLRKTRDGRRELPLTQAPLFVPGVEQWLTEFRAAIHLTPEMTTFSIEPQRHTLNIQNPHDRALSGNIALEADTGWEIEPHRVRFALQPGATERIPLLVRHPQNASAGAKTIRAHVQFASDPKYRMEIPLRLELDLSDVDVWGYALSEGDRVVIHHGVTNRSDAPLSFRAFAMLPGRSRQYRVINELLPGQTLDTEYVFRNVSDAAGRSVRLGLREVNGPRRHNLESQIP